jgi:competence protein CoiA
MRIAHVCGKRTEASKGARGECPSCGSDVIAKCGQVKVNHWAHIGKRNCDSWWEKETEWHRAWKNNFPIEWQEIPMPDELTSEKHIADVRTSHDLIIEFQHSHIDPEERYSREKFYQNMVWVVDGTRLKRDYPRFLKGINSLRNTTKPGHYVVDFPNKVFPNAWLDSSVPVILIF